jgi:hypothetical protein
MVQAYRSDFCPPQHNIGTDEELMMFRTDDIFELKGSEDSQHRPKSLSKRAREQYVIAVRQHVKVNGVSIFPSTFIGRSIGDVQPLAQPLMISARRR